MLTEWALNFHWWDINLRQRGERLLKRRILLFSAHFKKGNGIYRIGKVDFAESRPTAWSFD